MKITICIEEKAKNKFKDNLPLRDYTIKITEASIVELTPLQKALFHYQERIRTELRKGKTYLYADDGGLSFLNKFSDELREIFRKYQNESTEYINKQMILKKP